MTPTALKRSSVYHPLSEDALEEYLMGRLSAEDEIRIEEHVLWCHECSDGLEGALIFIEALQSALLGPAEPVRENAERIPPRASMGSGFARRRGRN